MKLVRMLANLGYGSRRDVEDLLRDGLVQGPGGKVLGPKDADPGDPIHIEGEPMDPRPPLTLVLHKPLGHVCSFSRDEGPIVHDLLPPRFEFRRPALSSVGRLDKDTTGLLLMTDDGQLLHRLTSPKHAVPKVYRATLDRPLRGDEAGILARGGLMLEGDTRPLAPARLEVLEGGQARLTVTEGRYHLVRRAFAALGNHVLDLHRESVGPLALDGLALGAWRLLRPEELALLQA